VRRKIVYVGYPLLTKFVKDALEEIDSPFPIEIIEVEIGEPGKLAVQLDQDESVAAIVTVRGHATFMPKMKNTPIIINKVTGDDFLHACKKAANFTDTIVVMRLGGVFTEFQAYDSLFNLTIHYDTYRNVEEARQKIRAWMKKGINTFVGTSAVISEAKVLGVNSIYLYSKTSILESIQQAINLVSSMESEKAKYERINTIIQNSTNALLSADANGKIEFVNDSLIKLIDIPREKLIGKVITDVLSDFSLVELEKGMPLENVLIKTATTHLISNITPIRVRKNILGFVATFQEISKVKDADTKIRKELAKKGFIAKYHFTDIIYRSDIMHQVIQRAKIYAQTNATILIHGETGTGKELFAQSIHNASQRKQHSFVAINCSALSENLLESELFGYEEGAFTGAKKGGKTGLFELAHKGTIFLDEIGEITPKLQSRLLRVLQEKEIMKVGGDQVIPIDVRIIAATNKDLRQLVIEGTFREDLYYRLNTLSLQLPSLSMRREDIPLLIKQFLSQRKLQEDEQQLIIKQMLRTLEDYPWNGNIRELENIVERIYVLFQHTKSQDLIQEVLNELAETYYNYDEQRSKLEEKVKQSEIDYIRKVLDEVGGNKHLASKKLGISRTTLWRKLNQ